MQEYRRDPKWTKETCIRVAKATGLSEAQVYKWGWDQKNKEEGKTQPKRQVRKEDEKISKEASLTSNAYNLRMSDFHNLASEDMPGVPVKRRQQLLQLQNGPQNESPRLGMACLQS